MKIRSKEELIDRLTDDLAWRKKELALLLSNVLSSKDKAISTNLRSSTVLLYAHWEGFIKNASEYYLNYVISLKLNLEDLHICFVAIALKQKLISEFEDTNKTTKYVKFIEYLLNNQNERAKISIENVIKTGSNLNSVILKELLTTIGIDFSFFDPKSNLIDSQLLNYRNSIAHGSILILDKSTYIKLHNEVVLMIDHVNTLISNAVVTDAFKRIKNI